MPTKKSLYLLQIPAFKEICQAKHFYYEVSSGSDLRTVLNATNDHSVYNYGVVQLEFPQETASKILVLLYQNSTFHKTGSIRL